MNRLIIVLLTFLGIGTWSIAHAQEQQEVKSIFTTMQHTEILKVKLSLPLDSIMANKRSEEDFPAVWSFVDESGELSTWKTKINIRGKYRRMKCVDVPPLKVTFGKKDLLAAGLSKYNDFKIVNYCSGTAEKDRELLLKEFLTYKLYNQVTDVSYQVQLLEIEYFDPVSKNSKVQNAFLIEDTAELRNRVGANKSKERFGITQSRLDPKHQQYVALFECMIGNNDWAFNGSKNIKYIEKDSILVPVPYDFDFSGIVAAPYASASFQDRANENLGIRPTYHGFETNYRSIKETLEVFVKKKKAIYATVKNFPHLSKNSRNEMRYYLDTFYNQYRSVIFASNN